MTVQVTNAAPGDTSGGQEASFTMNIFEYNCEVFCNQQGKIQDKNLIAGSVAPTNPTCLSKYCMEKRTRSSRVLNVINRAQSDAVCRYNQNCQVHISVSEVTAVKLTASTVATQLSVSFGSELAKSISLISQDGDDVTLLVESPIVTAAGIVDVIVQGSDESGSLLTAASIAGFKFKNAASGSLEFIGGSPLTGKAIGTPGTTSTLRVGNFPDDIAQSDIQVTIGGSVVSTISSFSVSETFEAKITILVPNATGCSSQSCVEDGYVSVTSRNLQTSFNFTYFEKDRIFNILIVQQILFLQFLSLRL
jgi:hypothetical protein